MPISTINNKSIADGTIIATDILDGTISSAKLVAANIAGDRIAANTLSNTVFQTGSVESYLRGANLDFGMRNRIINGAMVIDQRTAGAAVTPVDNQYSLDRWHTQVSQTAKMTIQKMDSANSSATGYEVNSAPAGFANSLKVTSLSSYSVVTGDYFAVDQCIEAFNLIDLNWGTANAKSVTLSFWVKSSLTGTFGGAIANGAFNRSYPFTYTISAANTWEQKIITIPGDTSGTYGTTNGRGAYIQFGLGSGSTYSGTAGAWAATAYITSTGATSVVGTNAATWYITGVQLEEGSQPTPFEYRQFTNELQLCQRYFQRFGGNSIYETYAIGQAYNTTNVWATIPLKVNMRANPTFSPTSGANLQLMNVSGTGYNCTACDIAYGSTTSPDLFPVVASGLVAGNASVFRSAGTTSGFISFSAEL